MATNNETDIVSLQYKEICKQLRLSSDIVNSTWRNFAIIKAKYLLEGEPLHWLAVSLYAFHIKNSKRETPSEQINLNKLLQLCHSNIYSFVSKSRRWADMNNLLPEYRRKIGNMEHSLAVTADLYNKYRSIFSSIFSCDGYKSTVPIEIERSEKVKKIMEFGWVLFLSIKSNNCDLNLDLVNSYHLLMVCCDYIYEQYIYTGERDILNPTFLGAPKELANIQQSTIRSMSIIDYLCQNYNGISSDTKLLKRNTWDVYIKQYFEKDILRSSSEFGSVLSNFVFEYNNISINDHYQSHIMNTGYFDERLFLCEDTTNGSEGEKISENGGNNKMLDNCNSICLASTRTPLTGQLYLQNGERGLCSTPVKSATQNVARLHLLINNRQPAPSQSLVKFVSAGDDSILENIVARVESMAGQISTNLSTSPISSDFAKKRVQFTKILYYKILEDILIENVEISTVDRYLGLLGDDIFHRVLFACSSEIVSFSYSLQTSFLWLSDVLNIHSFHFYKIIEIIVRKERQLSRDVIKDLQRMEEHILDHLSWEDGSPLWESLSSLDIVIPTSVAVSLPHETEGVQSLSVQQNTSPNGNDNGKQKSQTLGKVEFPKNANNVGNHDEHGRAKGIGNLQLFYRKFYYLAAIRMQDLCDKLNISDKEIRRRMWTCFEHTITTNIKMLRNRHLDQIIMCTVYVICKIFLSDISFQDIMKTYRSQPQAASHVYRNVFLASKGDSKIEPNCSEQQRGDLIKFYNQIFVKFIQNFISKFSSKSNQKRFLLSPLPIVSPISSPNAICRISDKHSVYIRCLENTKLPQFDESLKYCFNRSPAKDLQAINKAVQHQSTKKHLLNETVTAEVEHEQTLKRQRSIPVKLHGLIEERGVKVTGVN